jgi:6-phosphofructokinase 1
MVTVSEGATIQGGQMLVTGEADAYGHRKLGGIGEVLGAEIKAHTGEAIITQTLGYLMRSGAPDSLDLMVATNYAVMAADLAVEGSRGRLVALRNPG